MTERLLAFTDEAWQDYLYWQAQDKKTLKRINLLIKDALRTPRPIWQDSGRAASTTATAWFTPWTNAR